MPAGMELLKTVTGKVVSGAVALAVVAAGISWWRMDEATRVATVEPLLRAAREISLALGWSGDEPD